MVPAGTHRPAVRAATTTRRRSRARGSRGFRDGAADARATIAGFEPLQDERYDVARYSVVATVPVDGDTKVFVAQTTRGNGVWTVIWDFVRTARGDVLKSLTFTRASEFPCH